MEILPVKEVELSGGPADGMTHHVPIAKTRLSLKSQKKNDRLVYEYDHDKADGTEVFVLASREPLSTPSNN
jgi:hypothetical protein